MPTIDQLPEATASATTDAFMCSQGGIARQASLEQMLASVQPILALQPGQLVGRWGAGAGGAQPVTLGPNLSLSGGTLSVPPPFNPANLPAAAPLAVTDMVALAQSGQPVGLNYGGFMAGIAAVPGVRADSLLAIAEGGNTLRTLSALAANAVAAEDFGAKGDGVTDDTASLSAALASGQPVRLGPRTYCTSGQWTITGASAMLHGVPGQIVLRRIGQQNGGAWISIQSTQFRCDGVSFDANASITNDVWAVLVAAACTGADFTRCQFLNARGATMGCGLTFAASYPAICTHAVRACEAAFNTVHGIWVQAVLNTRIDGCFAHDNGAYGITMDYADPALIQKLEYGQIRGCTAWNNIRGLSVGNYNATNTTPPIWGPTNPDAINMLVAGNVCHDNTDYRIAVSGQGLLVSDNLLGNNGQADTGQGAGILANVSNARICGNLVSGSAQYGIDAGGSIGSDITDNSIFGGSIGINCGGGQAVRVQGNQIAGASGWGILVNAVETDGAGNNFGIACNGLLLSRNAIAITGPNAGGIYLADNPMAVAIEANDVLGSEGAAIEQAVLGCAADIILGGNRWNYAPEATVTPNLQGANTQIIYPDLLDQIVLGASPGPVASLVSARQILLAGQIGFVAVTAGGSNYTAATVAITGDGTGATAIAYASNGAVIGIALTARGSNYTTATAVISGDGTGAAAQITIGLPVLSGRRLRLRCPQPTYILPATESAPPQQNWTNLGFTIPAGASVEFLGINAGWQALSVPLSDFIVPEAAGTLALVSQDGGDIALHPTGVGSVRHISDSEAVGVTSTIGRGSPAGVVAAPPGSDFRNLNGGAGTTLWIKQTGSDANGWLAIA